MHLYRCNPKHRAVCSRIVALAQKRARAIRRRAHAAGLRQARWETRSQSPAPVRNPFRDN
jgi:hypothetical protein